MRMRLNIDENLLNQAMEFSPGKTKDKVINEALAQYVSHKQEAQLRILELAGQVDYDPDYDYKAERRAR